MILTAFIICAVVTALASIEAVMGRGRWPDSFLAAAGLAALLALLVLKKAGLI